MKFKKISALILILIISLLLACSCQNNNTPFVQKNYTHKALDIKQINIDVKDRQLDISPSNDNNIYIDYFENQKEFYDIFVSDDNTLNIILKSAKEWTDFIGTKPDIKNRKIAVKIPNSLIDMLNVSTTNEDIFAANISINSDISLSNNGGNIAISELDTKNSISLTCKNANITGTITGSYDDFNIFCTIKKGDCNLPLKKENGEKDLTVNANNGDVNIEFVK